MVSSRPKKGARPVFNSFSCSNDFMTQKVYFSQLMRVYVGLIMLSACPGFLASYWSAGFGTFLQVSALASHWLEGSVSVTLLRRKTTNTALTTLSAIKASN